MSLRDCKCGKPVRLGARKIRVNRKQGVYHYIAHMDGETAINGQWCCAMFKPYPKDTNDREYKRMMDRWNATPPPDKPGGGR